MATFFDNISLEKYVNHNQNLILPKLKIGDKVYFKKDAIELIKSVINVKIDSVYLDYIKEYTYKSFNIAGKYVWNTLNYNDNKTWRSKINELEHWVHDISLTKIPPVSVMYKPKQIMEFNEFINEGNAMDYLKPKTKEEIKKITSIPIKDGLVFKRVPPSDRWGFNIGGFYASYNDLVKLFGNPETIKDKKDKTFNELNDFYWDFIDSESRQIRIFNHKKYNKIQEIDKQPDVIVRWEIGGYETHYAKDIQNYIYSLLYDKKEINNDYKKVTNDEYVKSTKGAYFRYEYDFKTTYNKLVSEFGEPDIIEPKPYFINLHSFRWTIKDNKNNYYEITDYKLRHNTGLSGNDLSNDFSDVPVSFQIKTGGQHAYIRRLIGYINRQINEGNAMDYLKPKSKEDMIKALDDATDFERVKYVYSYDLPEEYLPEKIDPDIKDKFIYYIKAELEGRHHMAEVDFSNLFWNNSMKYDFMKLGKEKTKKGEYAFAITSISSYKGVGLTVYQKRWKKWEKVNTSFRPFEDYDLRIIVKLLDCLNEIN